MRAAVTRRGPAGSASPGSAAYDAIIEPMRDLADPARVPDAFEAEVMVGVLVGMVFQVGLADGLLTTALLDVVDELARSGLAHAYPSLRTLLGPPAGSCRSRPDLRR